MSPHLQLPGRTRSDISNRYHRIIKKRKTVYVKVPPGKLGVTIHTNVSSFGVITSINLSMCKFADRVSKGDRIVSVDGMAARCMTDLRGDGGERVLGIVKK